ncbi:MAG: nicotinamide-nucleotide amidohydrolase family protein, partial [Proteobacteria bacterium]|nr:nicotinamide-nucleotide amidohydrolase family protein [Pseudomonadota bacterium]
HLEAMPDNHSRGVSQKVYKVFGLPETEVNSKLKDIENKDERIRIGYYPVFPEVHVSITVLGGSQEESDSLFQQYDAEIVRILGDCVFATDSETMEEIIGNHLTSRQKTLAVAESCSGGLISHKLTKRPGSSVFFVGGVVAYSNDLKQNILGVDSEILLKYGAVSAETVRAMADGVKRITKADYALSVTGIAGPTGGTGEKPVGTVYIGLAAEGGIEAYRYHFSGDRWQVQAMTSMAALDLLRRQMLGLQMKID